MSDSPDDKPSWREIWTRGSEYQKAALEGRAVKLGWITVAISVAVIVLDHFGIKLPEKIQAQIVTGSAWMTGIGSLYYLVWHRPFSDMIVLEKKNDLLEAKILDVATPQFEISCAKDGDGSVSRDWPVRYEYLPVGGSVVPQIRKTDFFGFSIRNTGTKTVKNLTARITKVRRVNDSEEWRRPIALSFEPETITKTEPIESVDLWHTEWQSCCVCSVREEPEGIHVIMAGSINMTSRYGTMFERFFDQKGKYVFYVSIRADDLPTKQARFLFDWKGTRQESEISLPADRPSFHENQSTKHL